MPEHLLWSNSRAFIVEDPDTSPFLRRMQAQRELGAARAAFLSQLKVKPEGVSDTEYLWAHGLTREALGTAAARDIGL